MLEAVAESSIAGIYVFRDGRFLYVNPALAKIFGYEKDELEGKLGPEDLTHPDDRLKVAEYVRRRLAGEVESARYTVRGVRKDGEIIQCEVLGRIVDLVGGPAVAGTLFDITERELVQQTLLESEALFRGLAVKSPSGVFINQGGRVVFANGAASALTGYSVDELTNPDFNFLQLIAPDSLDTVESMFRQHMSGKELPPYECRLVGRGGKEFDSIIATRLIAYKGKPAILGIVTDVTQRKAAELELRRLLTDERRHRKLAEAVARVGLSLTSDFQLTELLNVISKASTEVFDVSSAFVWMVEGEELVGFAGHGPGIERFVGQRLSLTDTESLAPTVAREARPIFVNHARDSKMANQRLIELFDAKAILAAPLIRGGQADGVLVLVESFDPERFKEDDLEAALALGSQMAIAIANAQFVNRELRRLQQLTSLISASSVISSTLELDALLGLIAAEMCRAINATSAYIWSFDRKNMESTVIAEFLSRDAVETGSDLGHTYDLTTEFVDAAKSIEERRARIVHADDPGLRPFEREHLRRHGARSTMTIPLESGGKVIAYAEIWESRAKREFTEEEIDLCQAIGHHAAVAIENGRLYKRVQEELSERRRAESELAISVGLLEGAVNEAERMTATQRALRDSMAALSKTLDLDEVLDRILVNVGRVVPSDTVDIMLLEHEADGDVLSGVRGRGYRDRGLEGWLEAVRLPVQDMPSFKRIVQTGQPYTIPDVRDEPDWIEFPETDWIKSYAAAPIKSKGELIGVLNLCSETAGFFSPAVAEVLQSFADQAAVAIENARLFSQAQQELAERRRAEEELRKLSELNASVLQEMADGVVLQDAEGYFTFVNPAAAALFGSSPEEVVGQHWTKFVPADQRPLVQLAEERRRRGLTDRYELELLAKGGKSVPVLVSGRPRYEDGEYFGTIAVFTDITERRRAEEGERAYLRSKEGVLVSASRNLRVPTQSLIDFLEQLAGGQVDDPEWRQYILAKALENAKSLSDLVENVVGVAEMDSRSVELDWGVVAIEELVSDILLSNESLALEKEVTLSWESPDLNFLVRADRTRLRQALGNVVENAIRHSDKGTAVRVEAEPRGGGIEIYVVDHGPGISKADQQNIFEKPYLRSTGGKGIHARMDLYDSRAIIESHGGSIWVEREPKSGNRFTVFVPGYP